jgi:catechol 2,3-dioxygenase-like lactoylglutathione lyase family enzyme
MLLLNKIKLIAAILLIGSMPLFVPHYFWPRAAVSISAPPSPAAAPAQAPDQTPETKFAMSLDLPVVDPKASNDFYEKLGFIGDWQWTIPNGNITAMGIKGGIARIVFTAAHISNADRAAHRQFKIVLSPTDNTPLADFHDQLIAKGIKAGDIANDPRGNPQFSVEDPDGYLIEFKDLGSK